MSVELFGNNTRIGSMSHTNKAHPPKDGAAKPRGCRNHGSYASRAAERGRELPRLFPFEKSLFVI
jgi:hypothetical protein